MSERKIDPYVTAAWLVLIAGAVGFLAALAICIAALIGAL